MKKTLCLIYSMFHHIVNEGIRLFRDVLITASVETLSTKRKPLTAMIARSNAHSHALRGFRLVDRISTDVKPANITVWDFRLVDRVSTDV